MRRISVFAFALVLLGGLAIACGDDDQPPPPTPEGPTTLSLTKTMEEIGERDFRFTLELTNKGDNAAVNIVASDVWEEGLVVTEIGTIDGQQPEDIDSRGLEFILRELEAGRTVQLVYTARCFQGGEWENAAVVSAVNSEPAEDSVTVTCP